MSISYLILCIFSDSPGGNTAIKSEKKTEGNSFFSWLLVLALLGAWLSVGVMWFDLVDYNSVVGKFFLFIYFLKQSCRGVDCSHFVVKLFF